MGYAHDGGFRNSGEATQKILDLPWIDVAAAADDHLLEPSRDTAIALAVDHSEIAGAQEPAIVKQVRPRLRITKIAAGHMRALFADLSHHVPFHGFAGHKVSDADMAMGEWCTHRG